MKNLIRSIIPVAAAIVMIMNSGCQSPLNMKPQPGRKNVGMGLNMPTGLNASHGEKRKITLRWEQFPGAVRYYIFSARTPLLEQGQVTNFMQCGETADIQYTFGVDPGSTIYYRISAIMANGKESEQSAYVMGSSLAQPFITDITDVTESSATVTWYMDNVSNSTYKTYLRYIVYCFNGSQEVAQLTLDGSQMNENKAVFTGLNASIDYSYQVEAYLVSDQNENEKSDIMNKETARRFRPSPAENLKAAHGTAVDSVAVTFDLPEMVNIALTAGEFELHGLYFVIYRRLNSVAKDQDYLKVCAYFGAGDEGSPNAASKDGSAKTFGNYEIGKTVTWTDTGVARGVEYEYMVQSYVDGTAKTITSDESKASAVGWALAKGTLSIGTPLYNTLDGSLWESAEVPLSFTFDNKGVEYRYMVVETIKPLEDAYEYDPDGEIRRESSYLNYQQIKTYVARMDLTRKTTASSSGRGLYSFAVAISLPGATDIIETLHAIGNRQISEDMHPIVVTGFTVQDGYTDKFRIKWDDYANRKYVLYKSADGVNWTAVNTYNPNPSSDENLSSTEKTVTLTGYSTGETVYFAMQPIRVLTDSEKKGQWVYWESVAQTLGVPELQPVTERSYSTVTAVWEEAQKADRYRVNYRYTGDANWVPWDEFHISDLSRDANNRLKVSFKPSGYNDVTKAGKELQIMVEALNRGLQQEEDLLESEIRTASTQDVRTRLVGPAELAAQVTQAADARKIELSWNPIDGADGYYIYRRQFSLNNTYEEGAEPVVYYVYMENGAVKITGKKLKEGGGEKIDAAPKAHASLESGRYRLTDEYLDDGAMEWNSAGTNGYSGYTETYRHQQNELAWGNPYRYYIVPAIDRNGEPEELSVIEFTYGKDPATQKNAAIASYNIGENVSYNNAASLEKTGFTIGFGLEVTASKGTKSESGQVEITWRAPALLVQSGFTPRYVVFRKRNSKSAAGSADTTWRPLIDNLSNTSFMDQPQERGIAYDYAVCIYPASANANTVLAPTSPRFIEIAKERYLDEKDRPKLIGFTLASVRMNAVSKSELKDAQGNFAEDVVWYAGGIDGADSYKAGLYDNNWGIDGYEIYVMNRNVDNLWHKIAELSNLPNNTNQTIRVSNVQGGATLESGLLKVQRDYKHYFKVRSYVIDESDEKVLCPDPPFIYQYWDGNSKTNGNPRDLEQQYAPYIKWGARQITANEFIQITALVLADGLYRANGNRWDTAFFGAHTGSASKNYGSSGSVSASGNFTVTSWDIQYTNFKTDFQTKAGKLTATDEWLTFMTISGNLWAGTGAVNQYPQNYGSYANDYLNVTGPADTPLLYSGRLRYGNPSDVNWNSGQIHLYYPSNAAEQHITVRGQDLPLPFNNLGTAVSGSRAQDRLAEDRWY